MLARFGLVQARKAPRRASAPTRPLFIVIAADAPLLLVGEVEVSDVLGFRGLEPLPVFVVVGAGTVLRTKGTSTPLFYAQNRPRVLTGCRSPQ